jgi:hypothetical protein
MCPLGDTFPQKRHKPTAQTWRQDCTWLADIRAILDLNHDLMLKQKVRTKLDTASLMPKPAEPKPAPPANLSSVEVR